MTLTVIVVQASCVDQQLASFLKSAVINVIKAVRDTNIKSIYRDRKKEDSGRRRSKTPPKSYSTARRSHSGSR